MSYLWTAYLRLRRRTGYGAHGPIPVSLFEIDAFCRRSGIVLVPWEISLIEAIDDIWLEATKPKTIPKPQEQTISIRPMTPTLFDAVFGGR